MHGAVGIKVTVVDARPFSEVVNDRLIDGDVVINEWQTFVNAAATEDRDTSEAKPGRSDDFSITVGFNFDLLLLKSDEFGINCNVGASDRSLCFWTQELTILGWSVAGSP